jgi:hypothetical protein
MSTGPSSAYTASVSDLPVKLLSSSGVHSVVTVASFPHSSPPPHSRFQPPRFEPPPLLSLHFVEQVPHRAALGLNPLLLDPPLIGFEDVVE